MTDLSTLRVAVLVTDGFEEAELTQPVRALKSAGATVEILSPSLKPIQGFQHHEKAAAIQPDGVISKARSESYDAVLLPGGALNADSLRAEPAVQSFVRAIQAEGKPIAAICHAPWVLISAGLVPGRTLTSYHTLEDDLRNAGGNWIDRDVIVEKNWVTSRTPDDLPVFNLEMLNLFSQQLESNPTDRRFKTGLKSL